jgi:hypothetical protein
MTDLFGNEKMLALSWKQPFGSAMLVGKIETRVWETKYRGLVLICLSKVPYSEQAAANICGELNFAYMCRDLVPVRQTIDLNGMAIAVGRLVNCREMRPQDEGKTYVQYRAPWVEEREGKDGVIRKINRRLYCHIYGVEAVGEFLVLPHLTKAVLTIAHLDHDETNHEVKLDRLMAMCQLHHLRYDAKEKYRRIMNKTTPIPHPQRTPNGTE